MKRAELYQKCITCLLLVVFLITGSGVGLGEEYQVFSSSLHHDENTLSEQVFTTSGDLHIFEIRESHSAIFSLRGFKNNRSDSFGRSGFLFLCVLAILSGIFQRVQETFTFYDRLYIHDRFYMITFMHDTDGRKRTA